MSDEIMKVDALTGMQRFAGWLSDPARTPSELAEAKLLLAKLNKAVDACDDNVRARLIEIVRRDGELQESGKTRRLAVADDLAAYLTYSTKREPNAAACEMLCLKKAWPKSTLFETVVLERPSASRVAAHRSEMSDEEYASLFPATESLSVRR